MTPIHLQPPKPSLVKELRRECRILSEDVAQALQSRSHWRARARVAEGELAIALADLDNEREAATKRPSKAEAPKRWSSMFEVGDWVRVKCLGHPANGGVYRVGKVEHDCEHAPHYTLEDAPCNKTDGGSGGAGAFWCGVDYLERVENPPHALSAALEAISALTSENEQLKAKKASLEDEIEGRKTEIASLVAAQASKPLAIDEKGLRFEIRRIATGARRGDLSNSLRKELLALCGESEGEPT